MFLLAPQFISPDIVKEQLLPPSFDLICTISLSTHPTITKAMFSPSPKLAMIFMPTTLTTSSATKDWLFALSIHWIGFLSFLSPSSFYLTSIIQHHQILSTH